MANKKSKTQSSVEKTAHSTTTETPGESNEKRSYFSLDSQPLPIRRRLLATFADTLRERWRPESEGQSDSESGDEGDKTYVMEKVAEQARILKILPTDGKIPARQWDSFLRALYQLGSMRLGNPLASDKVTALKERTEWGKNLREIIVAAGSDKKVFEVIAAEDFIGELFRIGSEKKKANPEAELNVGIVSGNTLAGLLRAARLIDWSKQLGLSAKDLPPVRIFALNVCLTVGEHISGNANILVHMLSEKIVHEGGEATAFGLSAPLLVEKERLEDFDKAPQTIEVVTVTEPFRNPKRRSENISKTHTDLDIILTGVGELPVPQKAIGGDNPAPGKDKTEKRAETDLKDGSSKLNSIFYNLAVAFGFEMVDLVKSERIVGDIAFSAIRADGEPVALKRHVGSPKLIEQDIKDLAALISELKNEKNPLSVAIIRDEKNKEVQALRENIREQQITQSTMEIVIRALNEIIEGRTSDPDEIMAPLLSERTKNLIRAARNDKALINRHILEAAYPTLIAPVGTEYMFYCAVQLPIFEAMAKDKNKTVMLVARHDANKYKVPAIYASVAGVGHRYCSRLCIDEDTALRLLLLSAPDWAEPM